MAGVLGWSAADRDRELAAYLAGVDADVRSQAAPDDEAAERLGRAPETGRPTVDMRRPGAMT